MILLTKRINANARAELMRSIHDIANAKAVIWKAEKFFRPRYKTREIAAKAIYVVTLDRKLKYYAI